LEFNDFEFAPNKQVIDNLRPVPIDPNKQVIDNLRPVPIDIYKLEAKVVCDVSIRKCKVISKMYFKIGNENGNPFFDLRQNIQNAYLNDEHIPIEKIEHYDFGPGPDSKLRIIEKSLPSNSSNVLKLEYELNTPDSENSKPIEFNSDSLYFDFWFSDMYPGRYLEMWFPSNLIYDHFAFHLDIQIINSNLEHNLFSNGEINKIGNNSWIIDFPNNFTSLSHMLYICPKNNVEEINDIVVSPDSGKNINLNLFKLKNNDHVDINRISDTVKKYISENILYIGPYIHGNKFSCFIWESPGGRSMEYDGAVTTTEKYLKHETFHSWFARGLKPATQNDSWFDEAWTCYNTDDTIQPVKTFDMSEAPVRLSSSENPFNRVTPGESFEQGIRFFSGLAAELGRENLKSYMNSFYKENYQNLVTTKQLETYLIEKSGKSIIQKYFNRFVYGQSE
jgi:hypothetical protein